MSFAKLEDVDLFKYKLIIVLKCNDTGQFDLFVFASELISLSLWHPFKVLNECRLHVHVFCAKTNRFTALSCELCLR